MKNASESNFSDKYLEVQNNVFGIINNEPL